MPAEATPYKSYTGPLSLEQPTTRSRPDYTGPVQYRHASVVPAGNRQARDYTGPVDVLFLDAYHLYYGRIGQKTYVGWDEFVGSAVIGGTNISLGKQSFPAQIGATNTLFYYRYGTLSSFANTPTNSSKTGYGFPTNASVTFGGKGVSPANGFASANGVLEDFAALDGTKRDLTMGAIVSVPSGRTGTLWGFDDSQYSGSVCFVRMDGTNLQIRAGYYYDYVKWYLDIPLDDIGLDEGDHSVLVHLTTTDRDNSNTGQIRVWVDGRLMFDGVNPYSAWYDYTIYQPQYPAALAGLSYYDYWSGERQANDLLNGGWVDEAFWAGWSKTTTAVAKYTTTTSDQPVLNTAWTAGAEEDFETVIYADPAALGTEHAAFITAGPVEDVNLGSEYHIVAAKVKAYISDPTQQVLISTRASDTIFTQTSTSLPWSPWTSIVNGTNVAVAGGGTGRYVQIRLKLLPSTDLLTAPVVESVFLTVGNADIGILTSDLPGHVNLTGGRFFSDIFGNCTLIQGIAVETPGHVKVVVQMPSSDLLGQVSVVSGLFSDLSGRVHVLGRTTSDLSGHVEIEFNGIKYITDDRPGHVKITKTSFFSGLLGSVRVRQKFQANKGGHVNVMMNYLPGHVLVRGRMTSNKLGRVNILLDAPGPVLNLHANVPLGVYQSSPNILMLWDAAVPARSPVQQYRWWLDQNPTTEFNPSWNTTTQLQAGFTLSSPGTFYFHVAATSTAGFTGPVTHATVMFNRVPTTPGNPTMTVNGQNTLGNTPLLTANPAARPLFGWSSSIDPDGSAVSYEIQIAIRSDFAYDEGLGKSSILYSASNLPTNSHQLGQNLKSGIWFWRIRSSDGKQSSDWSAVGGFRVNVPPRAPTNLLVTSN